MVQQEKLEYEENRVETPKKLEQNGVKMMEFNEIGLKKLQKTSFWCPNA
jgi:hypothetical protein